MHFFIDLVFYYTLVFYYFNFAGEFASESLNKIGNIWGQKKKT